MYFINDDIDFEEDQSSQFTVISKNVKKVQIENGSIHLLPVVSMLRMKY